jgi:DNA helicase-2/ATP-dependent DNA helicase PcrA
LTFTKAAARELRMRVEAGIGEGNPQPRIQTLHSFSLRQLLRNSDKVVPFPQPLRVADDWEERYIVQEDLKRILEINTINEIQEKFNLLSSDWETLSADSGQFSLDPKFIGAWQAHRRTFRYVLRSELVYQLKKALEQIADFTLESPMSHLLIDEYQDLNKCDLAVINALASNNCELFIAGDDDQSIYGFRNAHPQGIRNFLDDYPNSEDLTISTCLRCDKAILEISEFVAEQDYQRINKGTLPKKDALLGEVLLYIFEDQFDEARNIAKICDDLINIDDYSPSDILILSRSDTHSAFSRVLEDEFAKQSIPFSAKTSFSIFNESHSRRFLSILRLLRRHSDDLAWRTLIKLQRNNIGDRIIERIVDLCMDNSHSFYTGLIEIKGNPQLIPSYGSRIAAEIDKIEMFLTGLSENKNLSDLSIEDVHDLFFSIANFIELNEFEEKELCNFIDSRIDEQDTINLDDFLQIIEVEDNNIEQELSKDSVNMLTMHRAKGLTSKAVIILGVEDRLIPGRQDSEPKLGDERRLLFVSLSRAKHKLIITYCTKRLGHQRRLGRPSRNSSRRLTRFLSYSYLVPIRGGYKAKNN